jgi:hypothetical protein
MVFDTIGRKFVELGDDADNPRWKNVWKNLKWQFK